MSDGPGGIDLAIAAAREHTTTSRRTRAHVIVCHDLNTKSRTLLDLFILANNVAPEACAAVARELAEDILRDVLILKTDLDAIESFARRQIARLDGGDEGGDNRRALR
jgi:hypothetical protein